MRILIVDHDSPVTRDAAGLLRREGHRAELRVGLPDARGLLRDADADLIVLDTELLPFPDVLRLCRDARRCGGTMLLLVGRRDDEAQRAKALEAGADLYVARPEEPEALVASIRALVRRHPFAQLAAGWERLPVTNGLWLDLAGQRLVGERGAIELTRLEFRLLAYLVRRPGRVAGRDELFDAVWGGDTPSLPHEVDVYVRYLRKKLEPDPANPRYLKTVWGRGYRYEPPAQHHAVMPSPASASSTSLERAVEGPR